MPITHGERHNSRQFDVNGQGAGLTIEYFVGGTMNENDVYLTALLNTPAIADNLVRDGIRAEHQGGGNWYAFVTYKNLAPQQGLPTDASPAAGGTTQQGGGPSSPTEFLTPNFTVDTTGGTERIFIALRDMEKKSASGFTATDMTRASAPGVGYQSDTKRVIGQTPEGVAGTERFVPHFSWTVTWPRGTVDKAYLRAIRNITGSVNHETFYQWQPGEVLFRGANINGTNGRWDIAYHFEVNENRTNVEIGNGITLERVDGWELVDVEFTTTSGKLSVPKSARVREIYPRKNFKILEIGT